MAKIKWQVFGHKTNASGAHLSLGWCETLTGDDYFETMLRMEEEARRVWGKQVAYVAAWKGDEG